MKIIMDFAILALVYAVVLLKKWAMRGKTVLLVNTVIYVYLSFVMYFTLMPITASLPFILNHPYVPMNLIPFVDVVAGRGDFVRQVVLNIIMTVPLGFLLPLTEKKNDRLLKVMLCTFVLSLGIELLQPLINGVRSSDITDVITNTVGGTVGYGLYLLCRPVALRAFNRINK